MTAAGRRRWPRSTTQVRGGQLTRLVCFVVLPALAHLHLALVAQRNDCLLPTVLQVPGSAANTVEVEMRPNLLLPPPLLFVCSHRGAGAQLPGGLHELPLALPVVPPD